MMIFSRFSGNTAAAAVFLALVSVAVSAAPALPPLNETPSGVSLPGKFTWFDLATPAIANQREFYSYVFGWTYRSPGPSDDGYVLIMNDGRAIGGMFSYSPPGGEEDGAIWVSLMSADDPGAAASVVEANGGSVEIGVTDAPRRGRHALFRDPGGALFGVLKSDSGDPPDVQAEIGEFIWVDLFARDVERVTDFYQALAPFEAEVTEVVEDVRRTVLSAHGMPRAGIVGVDEEANRSAWVPYVRVDDVAATLEKVEAGGGFPIVPPDERLLDGNLAVFVDPNGGVTGIVSWDYGGEEAP